MPFTTSNNTTEIRNYALTTPGGRIYWYPLPMIWPPPLRQVVTAAPPPPASPYAEDPDARHIPKIRAELEGPWKGRR